MGHTSWHAPKTLSSRQTLSKILSRKRLRDGIEESPQIKHTKPDVHDNHMVASSSTMASAAHRHPKRLCTGSYYDKSLLNSVGTSPVGLLHINYRQSGSPADWQQQDSN